MRILIITSCTGEKKVKPANQLTLEDFRQGARHVKSREKELKEYVMRAGDLYTGEQHVRLMRGVQEYRENGGKCQVMILSAGYGLIPEDRLIAPYECTFSTMKAKELREWAQQLKAHEGIRTVVAAAYDIGLILLGDNYLKACMLDAGVKLGGQTLLFAGTGPAKKLPRIANLRVVTLSNLEAKRVSCGLVGLKGELAGRLLRRLSTEPDLLQRLKDPATDVLGLLDDQEIKPSKTQTISASRPNPKVDHVIALPTSWKDKPHREKIRYFIPEWDDLVDPEYDFINDDHSGGKGDWSNEVYAHQMYSEPNYDGILMSRARAEKSRRKRERLNALGVHRFLRVPRGLPIMGDCGAFDYIMEEAPPYSTDDVIDYYTRLDFDYGVSVDHLIVKATENQKKFRYDLTIHNAEEFIQAHRKAKLKWEPVGAVQGWDADSYARAAAQYVKMGYRYIGLGGLVRTTTTEILRVLDKVKQAVPTGLGIHLFGVARLKAILQMVDLGVTSVDSASALRRAWLGGKDNYWTETGEHYRAIRIPEAEKSFRAKRMVSERRAAADFVAKIEQKCMGALHAYDEENIDVETVLSIIDEYDHLITPDRPVYLDEYRRTLEAKPWKICPCDICKRDRIDVMIFRGNNRNRRRGFHNTYIFYRLLQKVLETGDASFLLSDKEKWTNSNQTQLFR